MKRFACIILTLILTSTSFFSCEPATGKEIVNDDIRQYENAYRYNIQGWIYLYIEGEPYQRGFQHGYLLSDEIVDMITRWSNMIHNHPKIKKLTKSISEEKYDRLSEVWWNFCKKQCSKIYKDKYEDYPEYKNEIQGIADGVKKRGSKIFGRDVTYEDVLTCNEMYELLSKLTYKKLRMGIHPLLTLFKNLKEVEPTLKETSAAEFLSDFSAPSDHHKCNGFTATGSATSSGELVFANSMWSTDVASMWWWSYYITFRWSLILDINPSEGNRVLLASAPGYIWSDHDYYQNDAGITLLETTDPQGLWDNKGLPLAIRARRAMQYGNCIDDVMKLLRYRNDGCMNAVWLIGDAKTGEIARFELGYRNSWYNKISDGFHWSANNPMNIKVRLEKFNLKKCLTDLISRVFLKSEGTVYNSIRYLPSPRDLKYEELGNEYYGNIDIDVVKKIMSDDTIVTWSPDCKITDSRLLKDNGLWVFLGNPAGRTRDLYNISDKTLKIEEIQPLGWVRLYGLPEKNGFTLLSENKELVNQITYSDWMYNTRDNINTFYSSGAVVDDVLYSSTSAGDVNALSCENGAFLWNLSVGEQPTAPAFYDNKIFVGTKEGLKIINHNVTEQREIALGKIRSSPVIAEGKVFVGNQNGDVYALDVLSEEIVWQINLGREIYISNPWNNYLFVCAGKSCYAIELDSGKTVWSFETNGPITSKPFVCSDVVYFGSWDTFVYALHAGTGTLKWKCETGWGVETTPVVSEGLVFVGSLDNNFYAIDEEDGSASWVFTCKAAIHSDPVTYGEYVFFGCDDGRFYALDKKTGNVAWFFAPGAVINNDLYNYITTPILSSPVVDGGVVYIGAKGNIYALDAQTIEQPSAATSAKKESKIVSGNEFVTAILLVIAILLAALFIISRKKQG